MLKRKSITNIFLKSRSTDWCGTFKETRSQENKKQTKQIKKRYKKDPRRQKLIKKIRKDYCFLYFASVLYFLYKRTKKQSLRIS